jgi:glycine oxidase
LPIEPVRGQIVSLDAPSPAFAPIVWAGDTYLVPKRDGSLIVGATEERVGFDCRVTARGVCGLLASATALMPSLGRTSFRSAWAGLRPATPDGLPLIGAVPGVEGMWVAAGHHRNGVLLSPVTGELVADAVEGKGLPPDAAAFSPTRFGSQT